MLFGRGPTDWGVAGQGALGESENHPRGESEREEGVRGRTGGHRDGGGVHSWGGAKADGRPGASPPNLQSLTS
jgi:hypothetical protein